MHTLHLIDSIFTSGLVWASPSLLGLASPLCVQCRRWVSPTGDGSDSVKTGAILRDVTMHRDTTMRVKGWKGRHSDHSCSESDNRVSVLSVYLSGYLPPKGRSCFDVRRRKRGGALNTWILCLLLISQWSQWRVSGGLWHMSWRHSDRVEDQTWLFRQKIKWVKE